jgi:glycosyltransferase involved in cell wall biosynthesis
MQRRTLRGFGAVVAVSRALKTQLTDSGISGSRLHLVPNVYEPLHPPLAREDARARLGLSPQGTVIGWVGRLSHEKGADVAIEALARLGDRNWTAVFIGDGPERGALERAAEQRGIAGRMRWLGVLAGAGALFSAFDVFLLSSRTEGTPIVLLEAAAAGVPIVATDVGGVADLLGEAGAPGLAPCEPAALALLLAASLEQPDESRNRAERLRAALTGPAPAITWIDRHEAIYRSLLGGPSLQPRDS